MALLRRLLSDGGLGLSFDAELEPLVRSWIPRLSAEEMSRTPGAGAASIAVRSGRLADALTETAEPCIEVLGLRGWLEDDDHVLLRMADASLAGRVDLKNARAVIEVAAQTGEADLPRAVFCALTVTAALLLNRQDKLLLHAAAFVAPDGGAWLLTGDSQSGKSTTCANLIRAGWSFLADDQVVISSIADTLWVEGWPRRFNLDDGFASGHATGVRSPADPARFGAGSWQRSAPLGGLLLPRVEAARATELKPCSEADALQQLIRQSPWLLADRVVAAPVLRRMQAMAALPRYRVVLGKDTYSDPARLIAVLQPAIAIPITSSIGVCAS